MISEFYKASTVSKIHVSTVCQPSEYPRWCGNVSGTPVEVCRVEDLDRDASLVELRDSSVIMMNHDESRRTYSPVMICPPVMNLQLQDIRIPVIGFGRFDRVPVQWKIGDMLWISCLIFCLQEIDISSQSCLAFQILLRSRRHLRRRPARQPPEN